MNERKAPNILVQKDQKTSYNYEDNQIRINLSKK